jgi:NAD(P)-dependent dehydrogenase (short-subunit alcohol dehydrogenase family)
VGSALISGASSGIGRATALRLAAHGWTVFAGVRDDAAVPELAAAGVQPVRLDITDPDSVRAAADHVRAATRGAGLDALVNNAGIALLRPVEGLTADDVRAQFEVNVVGHVSVTNALLPLLRRAGGRIVFLSSVSGRVATPFFGVYSASKFAVEALADTLRIEVRGTGVDVVLVEPGQVHTPIWPKAEADLAGAGLPDAAAEHYRRALPVLRFVSRRPLKTRPERVARTVERALTARRPRARYVVGPDARAQILLGRVLPARGGAAAGPAGGGP